jgi:hypothetical protein
VKKGHGKKESFIVNFGEEPVLEINYLSHHLEDAVVETLRMISRTAHETVSERLLASELLTAEQKRLVAESKSEWASIREPKARAFLSAELPRAIEGLLIELFFNAIDYTRGSPIYAEDDDLSVMLHTY